MRDLQHDVAKLQSLLREHSDCFPSSSAMPMLQTNHASDRLVNTTGVLQFLCVGSGMMNVNVIECQF